MQEIEIEIEIAAMVDCNTTKERTNLSLCIDGVTPNDELLFKSLVQLLSHRTEHNWTFSTGTVDLQVIGEHSPKWEDGTMLANVLWIGRAKPRQSPFLHLPIHANKLKLLLNALGSKIIEKQTAAHKVWPSPIHPDKTFILHRWPPSSMLGTPIRIKLATLMLMTGHPVSINTLMLRSGATSNDCEIFCQVLDRAGLLQRNEITTDNPKPDQSASKGIILRIKPDLSLLSRIRRRLGLQIKS